MLEQVSTEISAPIWTGKELAGLAGDPVGHEPHPFARSRSDDGQPFAWCNRRDAARGDQASGQRRSGGVGRSAERRQDHRRRTRIAKSTPPCITGSTQRNLCRNSCVTGGTSPFSAVPRLTQRLLNAGASPLLTHSKTTSIFNNYNHVVQIIPLLFYDVTRRTGLLIWRKSYCLWRISIWIVEIYGGNYFLMAVRKRRLAMCGRR
jgi:hypothetical protein